MRKKNNETVLIYASVLIVVTVLSVLVIVTGIAARRSSDDTAVPSDSLTENDSHEVSKRPDVPESSRKPEASEKTDSENPKDSKDVIATDSASSDAAVDNVVAEPTLPEFVAPARGTVSKSHSVTSLVYSLTMDDYRTHSGIDISGKLGDVVVAVADGTVKSVYEDPMWGYCVAIAHEGDAVSYYKNLSDNVMDALGAGDAVKRGDVIGAVGESALVETAEEAHLHFELKVGGEPVDPCDYFEVPSGADIEE